MGTVPGKGGFPVLSRRFLSFAVWIAVGIFGVACWDSRSPDDPVVESPTTLTPATLTTEPTLDVPTPTPSPIPGRTTAHHDAHRHRPPALDPDGDCAYYSDTATNSRFHAGTDGDPNANTHSDTFRDANADTTAVADQSDIDPGTSRGGHVHIHRCGAGEPHARVRDTDAFPD